MERTNSNQAIYHYLDNLEEDKTVDARECYIRTWGGLYDLPFPGRICSLN